MKIKTLLLLAILLSTSSFTWSQYMMMSADAFKQGKLKAESSRSGYTDKTEVLGYLLEVVSARDASSGQSTGRRQYKPLTIWKASGASSPQFFQALSTNEVITKITLEFYKPDEVFKSQESLSYTITLENASVSSYRQLMGSPDSAEFKAKSPGMYDEIKFVFQKITVVEAKNKTSATDDWLHGN